MTIGANECSPRLRLRVFSAFNFTCEYCGKAAPATGKCGPVAGANPATVDRVVPRSMGGKYHPANVTLACLRCNSQKRERQKFVGPVRTLSLVETAK
jgi:5-methylcytosine-specific restriction endonuclease McrA